ATSIVYLDRQVLALTAVKIIDDFGLTNEQFGQIVAAFRYSYGLMQIFGGFLVDSYGPRLIFPLASGVWSLAGLLTGLAMTASMFTGLRFLLGAGEAFNWPCSLKVTNSLFSPKDRPLANGIFNSGAAMCAYRSAYRYVDYSQLVVACCVCRHRRNRWLVDHRLALGYEGVRG